MNDISFTESVIVTAKDNKQEFESLLLSMIINRNNIEDFNKYVLNLHNYPYLDMDNDINYEKEDIEGVIKNWADTGIRPTNTEVIDETLNITNFDMNYEYEEDARFLSHYIYKIYKNNDTIDLLTDEDGVSAFLHSLLLYNPDDLIDLINYYGKEFNIEFLNHVVDTNIKIIIGVDNTDATNEQYESLITSIKKYEPLFKNIIADGYTYQFFIFFPNYNIYPGGMKNVFLQLDYEISNNKDNEFTHTCDSDDLVNDIKTFTDNIKSATGYFDYEHNIAIDKTEDPKFFYREPIWSRVMYPKNALKYSYNHGWSLIDGEDANIVYTNSPNYNIYQSDLFKDGIFYNEKANYIRSPNMICVYKGNNDLTGYIWRRTSQDIRSRRKKINNINEYQKGTFGKFIYKTALRRRIRGKIDYDSSPLKYDTLPSDTILTNRDSLNFEKVNDKSNIKAVQINKAHLVYYHPDMVITVKLFTSADEFKDYVIDKNLNVGKTYYIPLTCNPDRDYKIIADKGTVKLSKSKIDEIHKLQPDNDLLNVGEETTDGGREVKIDEFNDILQNKSYTELVYGGNSNNNWIINFLIIMLLLVLVICLIIKFIPLIHCSSINNDYIKSIN